MRHIQKSKSAVFTVCGKGQLSSTSKHSVGDVWTVQLDRKRVPQAKFNHCKNR